jgi:hypothetical protein
MKIQGSFNTNIPQFVTTLHFRSLLMRNIVRYFGSSAKVNVMMNDNSTLNINPIIQHNP